VQAVEVGPAGEGAVAEDAELAAGDEHDLRAALAQGLGALGAVGEQRQDLLQAKVGRKRRKPDF